MHPLLLKSAALGAIILGEALAIYAEVYASHRAGAPGTFAKMFPVITLGGAFLLVGYMLGYRTFESIWIVAAASIAAILIIEPAVVWAFFHEAPTRGALIGLVLGTIGFISALTIR